MRHIKFTEEELKQIAHGSVYHERPIVRRRMQALWLKSQGWRHKEIGEAVGISPSTLRSYLDLYLEGGMEAIQRLGYQGKPNLLMERKDAIIVQLEANPPATYKEAQAKIQTITGLKRSLPQVREFLKKTGLRAAR